MNLLKFFYSVYALIMFTIVFLFWSPFLLFGVWFKSLSKPALRLKHIIAKSFMLSIFMPYSIQYSKKIDFNKQYVIIANHFSYFDIPAFVAINIPMKLIGKMDVSNIPLLGKIGLDSNISVSDNKILLANSFCNCSLTFPPKTIVIDLAK